MPWLAETSAIGQGGLAAEHMAWKPHMGLVLELRGRARTAWVRELDLAKKWPQPPREKKQPDPNSRKQKKKRAWLAKRSPEPERKSSCEQPEEEYPIGIYLDEIVIWQLGEFKEQGAIEYLQRIANFDPEATTGEPFHRVRASTVRAAEEAIKKIGDKGS